MGISLLPKSIIANENRIKSFCVSDIEPAEIHMLILNKEPNAYLSSFITEIKTNYN